MLSRSGPRKRKPSDQPLRRAVTHPDSNSCQCYKCGLTFLSCNQMNMHVARCKETNKETYDSTLTYTQGELKNAVQGYTHIHNNVEMGDAYRNQLHNQPSMLDMVIDLTRQMQIMQGLKLILKVIKTHSIPCMYAKINNRPMRNPTPATFP